MRPPLPTNDEAAPTLQQHPKHLKQLLQLKNLRVHYAKITNGKTIRAKRKITHLANSYDDIIFALASALYTMRNKPDGVLLSVY
ncbi:MAG: hypothetical protein OEY24_02520 [Candidatus Bathyarchaeota archaeon]|nr:hypothetical protein [Candidatus Bathyarchaeota archaeon]MDH5494564.1 hypothetical protein [Candidatus Bathyarchaeota archaeon]